MKPTYRFIDGKPFQMTGIVVDVARELIDNTGDKEIGQKKKVEPLNPTDEGVKIPLGTITAEAALASQQRLLELRKRLNKIGWQIIPLLPDLEHGLEPRLIKLLARFIRPSDGDLTDMDFVGTVFARWAREAGAHIGDPGDGVKLDDGNYGDF
jgi:hypothetical protein